MIFNVTGGGAGGSGATLTVTAPAGCTVTISKDGKTKTKTAGADGMAVFKGLETGTWTVTITNGSETASKTVEIVVGYATSITFFAATIHIIYPVGSVCTATDGITTLTAPDTSGTWVCVVPNTGTWTVSCDKTSKSIQITTNGQSEIINLVKTYLYTAGDTNKLTAVGWSAYSGQIATKPTITDKTSYVEIRIDGSDGGRTGVAYFQKMKLDYASKIHADLSFTGENDVVDANMFGVWSVINSGYYSSNAVASVKVNSSGTSYDIDVSNLEGEYYIGFGMRRGRNTPYIKVTSCYCV